MFSIFESAARGLKRKHDEVEVKNSKAKAPSYKGDGKSTVRDRTNLAAHRAGKFVPSAGKEQKWRESILKLDPRAEFTDGNVVDWKCGRCQDEFSAQTCYNVSRVRDHLKQCMKRRKLVQASFAEAVQAIPAHKRKGSQPNEASKTRPCPGLTEKSNPRIGVYLDRTDEPGGGARSLPVISREQFGKTYSMLTKTQKKQVEELQMDEHRWRNEFRRRRVVATACVQTVASSGNINQPCLACAVVAANEDFRRALRREPASEENLIFTNHRFTTASIGARWAKVKGFRSLIQSKDKRSRLLLYALKVADGTLKDNSILAGLVETVLNVDDRSKRGKGMQNFKWPPAYDQLMHIVAIESPSAFRQIGKFLPVRSERSFRCALNLSYA